MEELMLRNLEVKLADLKAEDEVDYQMTLRLFTILALLRNSWQSWYDCMAFDVMVEHLLHRIFNEELKARLQAVYQRIIQEIAEEVAHSGQDGYSVLHEIGKFKVCPICGRRREDH
ncbi:MAG: hypothetical protein HY790_07360 [Deltaproteobacteria bacterium]|nr:hypothetical protein [Deltaproteobacteria bacterium]MBI4795641.1 hypothetical protein [Deltaproteobacteria bacterium]